MSWASWATPIALCAACTYRDVEPPTTDACDGGAPLSATQVGDEGTSPGPFSGAILSGTRSDAPFDGQILVLGPIEGPPHLWVDNVPSGTLETVTLRDDPDPYRVRTAILPPAEGWPVGAPLAVHADLGGGYVPSFVFEAVDVPAVVPPQPTDLTFDLGEWQDTERYVVVRAFYEPQDPWAWVEVRTPDGGILELLPATGDQQYADLWQSRSACGTTTPPPPCAEAQLISAAGEPGPVLSGCAPEGA